MPTSTGVYKKKKATGDYQKGRELNKAPPTELKAFDTPSTVILNTGVGGPPTFNILNAMVNGAELYQRVGRKIYMKSLHLRGVIEANAAAQPQNGRIIVFFDAQPNGASPTITNLLQDSNSAAATTWNSEINLVNRQRFKILRDYQVMMGGVNSLTGDIETVPDPILNSFNIDFFIKLKGLEAVYNGVNGGTISDITSGAIFITFVGDTRAEGSFQLQYSTRLRYYD